MKKKKIFSTKGSFSKAPNPFLSSFFVFLSFDSIGSEDKRKWGRSVLFFMIFFAIICSTPSYSLLLYQNLEGVAFPLLVRYLFGELPAVGVHAIFRNLFLTRQKGKMRRSIEPNEHLLPTFITKELLVWSYIPLMFNRIK